MKLVIASLVVFSIVILFLFALFPSDIAVSRVIQINRAPADVTRKIDDLRQWKSWNEFVIHPSPREINNTTNEHGADSTFIDIGGVHIQLIEVHADTVVTIWRHGEDSFSSIFQIIETNGRTILAWDLKFHIKWYPWDKLASMFYDKNMGPLMEKSLLNLKNELESSTH